MNTSDSAMLRIIAIFKLFKVITLVLVGVCALKLIRGDAAATLTHWIEVVGLNPSNPLVDRALGKMANLTPVKFKELGIGSFVYAGLFLIEGTGLWLQKRWAEWFTVIITGSLVPLEIYEWLRHPTAGKALMLIVNVGVVAYLLIRIGRQRRTTDGRTGA